MSTELQDRLVDELIVVVEKYDKKLTMPEGVDAVASFVSSVVANIAVKESVDWPETKKVAIIGNGLLASILSTSVGHLLNYNSEHWERQDEK